MSSEDRIGYKFYHSHPSSSKQSQHSQQASSSHSTTQPCPLYPSQYQAYISAHSSPLHTYLYQHRVTTTSQPRHSPSASHPFNFTSTKPNPTNEAHHVLHRTLHRVLLLPHLRPRLQSPLLRRRLASLQMRPRALHPDHHHSFRRHRMLALPGLRQ